MNGLKISFAVVAFVMIQGVAVIWYISKLDSKVDQLYKGFEEENRKDVIENQVKMKLDLENIIAEVGELKRVIKKLKNKDERTPSEKLQDEIEPIPCPMHEDYDDKKDNV